MQAPSYDGHQGNVVFQPVDRLQKAIFYPTTRLDNFMEDFDVPATTIPRDHAQRFIKIIDRGVGQKQPLNGFMSESSQILGWVFLRALK